MRAVHVRAVNETYESELQAVRCPVELVWGANDTAARLSVATLALERLGDGSLHVEEGADHMLPLSHPHVVRAAIDRLLDRRPAAA
jgi:pimeloyl-ACP methyl ester carboxylesterase